MSHEPDWEDTITPCHGAAEKILMELTRLWIAPRKFPSRQLGALSIDMYSKDLSIGNATL